MAPAAALQSDRDEFGASALCDSCLIGQSPLVAGAASSSRAAEEWQRITDEDMVTLSTFHCCVRVYVCGGGTSSIPLGYQEEVRVGFCQVADDRVSHDSVSVSRAHTSAVLQQPVFFFSSVRCF